MKTIYIPKGESIHYESLTTEHLVVHGHLHVDYGIKAKTITGGGTINAGTVDADVIRVDDVESGSIVCKRLLAKRVQSPEVFASESAAVLISIAQALSVDLYALLDGIVESRPKTSFGIEFENVLKDATPDQLTLCLSVCRTIMEHGKGSLTI